MSQGLPGGLDASIETLEEGARRVDAVFASLGGRLGDALHLLQGSADDLDGLSAEFDGSLAATRQALAPVPGALRQLGRSLFEGAEALEAMSEDGRQASRQLRQLSGESRVVGAAARNARIEVARLCEAGDGSDFAEELAGLALALAETVARSEASQVALAALLRDALDAVRGFTSTQLPALVGLAGELDARFGEVEQWRHDSVEATALASRQSHRLLGALGDAIVAVQGGDSVRQRLEHTASTLRLVAEAAGTGEDPVGPVLRHVAGWQLRATNLRLRNDLDTVDGMLGLLRSEVEAASRLEQDLSRAEREGDSVRLLSRALGEATRLVASCETAHARLGSLTVSLDGLVDAFRRDAATLTTIVRAIVVVGINARIHAHHLGGDGRVLAVVTGEIKALVDQISIDAAPILPTLERMALAAGRIAAGSAMHAANIEELGTTVGLAVDSLNRGRDRLAAAIGSLTSVNAAVAAIVSESCLASGSVRMFERNVTRLAVILDAEAVRTLTPAQARLAAGVIERDVLPLYSMAEERRLHWEALAACGIEATDEPEETQAFDDFLL